MYIEILPFDQLILEFGHAVPINDDVKEKRKKLQMEVIPETVHKYPDVLRDIIMNKLSLISGCILLHSH